MTFCGACRIVFFYFNLLFFSVFYVFVSLWYFTTIPSFLCVVNLVHNFRKLSAKRCR